MKSLAKVKVLNKVYVSKNFHNFCKLLLFYLYLKKILIILVSLEKYITLLKKIAIIKRNALMYYLLRNPKCRNHLKNINCYDKMSCAEAIKIYLVASTFEKEMILADFILGL